MEICSKFHAFAKRNGEEKPIICFTVYVWCLILQSLLVLLELVQKCACMCVDVNESVVFSALLCVRVDCSSKRKDRNITAPLIWHEPVCEAILSCDSVWLTQNDRFRLREKEFFIPKSLMCQDWRDTLWKFLQLRASGFICSSHNFPESALIFSQGDLVCVCLCACVFCEYVYVCVGVGRRFQITGHSSILS